MAASKKYTFIGLEDPWTGGKTLNQDPFRTAVGSVWQTPFEVPTDPYYLENAIVFGKRKDPQPFSVQFGPVVSSTGNKAPYHAKHQLIKLKANPLVFSGDNCCDEEGKTWESYIDGMFSDFEWSKGMNPRQALKYFSQYRIEGITTKTETSTVDMGDAGSATSTKTIDLMTPITYHDCVFDHNVPFSKAELNILGAVKSTLFGEVDFEYDFYLEAYEKALENTKLPEIALPNMYLLESRGGLDGVLKTLKDNASCRAKEFVKLIGSTPYRVLMVPIENSERIKMLNALKENFPMRTEIEFSTDKLTYIADALKKTNLGASLMRRMTEFGRDDDPKFGIGQEYITKSKGRVKRKFLSNIMELHSWNLYIWMSNDSKNLDPKLEAISPVLPSDHTFIGPSTPSTELALSNSITPYEKVMGHLIFSGKLKAILQGYNRTFQQVLLGNKAHSETVMYRIVKYPQLDPDMIQIDDMDEGNVEEDDGNLVGLKADCTWRLKRGCEALNEIDAAIKAKKTKPIQEIWVANSSELDIFEYVDTQVKYDKGYTYVVYAERLSIGTDYFYTLMKKKGEKTPNQTLVESQMGDIGTIWKVADDSNTDKAEELCDKYNKLQIVVESLGLSDIDNEALAAYLALPSNAGKTVQQIFDSLIASGVSYAAALESMTGEMDTLLSDLADTYGTGFEAYFDLDGSTVVLIIEASWYVDTLVDTECDPNDYDSWDLTIPPGGNANSDNKWNLDFFTVCECPEVEPEACETGLIVTTMPSPMIYEVPYFVYDGRIMDSLPIFPGVDIIPYHNVNDKLLFNLTSNIGEYKLNPIIINPREERDIFEAMKSQGLVCGEKLDYASDDPATFFEIFRIKKKPKTYLDFSGHLQKLLPTDFELRSIQKGDSASHIDKVVPNVKYYYCFRTIDVHGHFSNPSPVYEVELIDADGAVYPVIKIIPLCQEPEKIVSKPMKKLMQIVPRITQSVVNEEKSGLNIDGDASVKKAKGHIFLGVEREGVWGKTFKIRLTSKKTCKKIDLNVTFDTEFINNRECIENLEPTFEVDPERPEGSPTPYSPTSKPERPEGSPTPYSPAKKVY